MTHFDAGSARPRATSLASAASPPRRAREYLPVALLGLFLVLAIGAAAYFGKQKEAEWMAFSAAHHCQVIGKMTGSVSPTTGVAIGADGKVGVVNGVTIEPDKTGYKCDDGMTYWR